MHSNYLIIALEEYEALKTERIQRRPRLTLNSIISMSEGDYEFC